LLEDVGVVLNYLTHEDTKGMIDSLQKYYPGVRTVIVDNGSPEHVVEKLYQYSGLYNNVSILPLKENLGFAKGNNAGIRFLREEGYSYICCSNNDIIIPGKGVLESLKSNLLDTATNAIAGPRIMGRNGRDQNPLIVNRPDALTAKMMMRKYDLDKVIKKKIVRTTRRLKKLIIKAIYKNAKRKNIITQKSDKSAKPITLNPQKQFVYALHGSFLMMGGLFFKYCSGFDEKTFLYGEEHILAEMLLLHNLKAVYVPSDYVIHKEDKTSDLLWGDKSKNMQSRYKRHSIKHWYFNYYRDLI
jgi:GT2 family glycosyltransferase